LSKALDKTYDGIIIGAGHHGLILGTYLARAGLSILLVDRRLTYGGGLCTREATLPGFYLDGFLLGRSRARCEQQSGARGQKRLTHVFLPEAISARALDGLIVPKSAGIGPPGESAVGGPAGVPPHATCAR